MRRKWIVFVVMPLLVGVLWGCPKKKPLTPPDDVEVITEPVPEPMVEDVAPSEPQPTEDMTEEELPSDLVELNRVLAERGLIQDVFFSYDRSDLEERARQALASNAQWMREHPEYVFTIEGHADERGTNEYNLALGQRRAASARDYIASVGVDAGRLRTISYGEERPFCTSSDESCWAENRRAHFMVTGTR
jgi:peptidoglycan-associated lipoprotein